MRGKEKLTKKKKKLKQPKPAAKVAKVAIGAPTKLSAKAKATKLAAAKVKKLANKYIYSLTSLFLNPQGDKGLRIFFTFFPNLKLGKKKYKLKRNFFCFAFFSFFA